MEGKPMFSLHKTRGGVHPPQCKDMRDFACTSIASPDKVLIPLNMHIGAPASPVVSEGDHVYVGTLIGQVEGLGSPIHASISGRVTKVATEQLPTGATAPVVEIASDGKMEADPALKAPEYATKEEFISCVRDSGMVGLGGASFPTWFKMRAPEGKSFEFLVVNGMECEPYITSDYRQMMEHSERVIDGVFRTIEALEIPAAVIGVEDNKKNGIESLNKVIAEQKAPVVVESLRCRYPQGGEKQLCQAITGKQVPPGGLPANIGCAVFNINTTIAIYHAIKDGMPVVRKVVTVSGSGVVEPKNLECPIGTPVSLLFDACGGLKDETFKLIAGGPMMGMAQASADFPVAKGTGAVLAFAANENKVSEDPTCIRCGRCVEACPMHLEPLYLYLYVQKNRIEDLEAAHVMDCIECGACSYICPGRLHLTHSFKVGKQKVKEAAAKAKAAAEAAKAAEEAKKEA